MSALDAISKNEQTRSSGSDSVPCCVSCPHCGKAIEPAESIYLVSFFGGAADRATLDLANIPMELRVVIDEFGNVDALDAEGDEPREGETVHLYIRREQTGWMHFNEKPSARKAYGQQSPFVITADYFPHNVE